jgi:hypothetical protein
MKTLSCKEVRNESCHFIASGETHEEIKKELFDRGVVAHADIPNSLTAGQRQAMEEKLDTPLDAK